MKDYKEDPRNLAYLDSILDKLWQNAERIKATSEYAIDTPIYWEVKRAYEQYFAEYSEILERVTELYREADTMLERSVQLVFEAEDEAKNAT